MHNYFLSGPLNIPADFVDVGFRAQVFHAAADLPFVPAAAGKHQLSTFVVERKFRPGEPRFHFAKDHTAVLSFTVYVVDLQKEL